MGCGVGGFPAVRRGAASSPCGSRWDFRKSSVAAPQPPSRCVSAGLRNKVVLAGRLCVFCAAGCARASEGPSLTPQTCPAAGFRRR